MAADLLEILKAQTFPDLAHQSEKPVGVSPELLKTLLALREHFSEQAYQLPKAIGLGATITVVLQVLKLLLEKPEAPIGYPRLIEIVKGCPKRGRKRIRTLDRALMHEEMGDKSLMKRDRVSIAEFNKHKWEND